MQLKNGTREMLVYHVAEQMGYLFSRWGQLQFELFNCTILEVVKLAGFSRWDHFEISQILADKMQDWKAGSGAGALPYGGRDLGRIEGR